MSSKPHVVHIGFNPVFKKSIDFENYQVSVVVHRFMADKMEQSLKDQFAGFGILEIPHNMNLNEYDNAMDQIIKLVDGFVAEFGKIDAIVGLYEHVTLPAAKLRERYGITGSSTETATLCRDKVKMKAALLDSPVRVPRYLAVDAHTKSSDIQTFVLGIPGKIVLKPRSQAASEGVKVFLGAKECLESLRKNGFEDGYEIEEFIEGTICHFDGVVRDGALRFFSAAEYLETCYDFVNKSIPLVAVTIDEPKLFAAAKHFTEDVIRRLGLENGVFHLEAFHLGNSELVFLEIGNRFGGAGVSPMVEKVYGIDLVEESVRADMNLPSKIEKPFTVLDKGISAAWLYMPVNVKERCRVRGISGLHDLPETIFYSELPSIGQWYNEYAMAFPSSGRFFLKAPNSDTVKRDCRKVMDTYKVELKTEKEWAV